MVITNSSRQRKASEQGTGKPLLGLNFAGAHRPKQTWQGQQRAGSILSSDTNVVCPYLKIMIIKLLHLINPTEKSMSKRLGDLFATQKSEISQ